MPGKGGWGMSVFGISQAKNMLEDVRMDFDGDAVYVVGPTTEYAIYHELGTSKMAARPFMRPAMERVRANPIEHARSISGADMNSYEGIVRAVAMAVAAEARQIAREKKVRDTGATIASIQARKVT